MAKKKPEYNPLSFWNLVSPRKSSNITWKVRKTFLWLHVYGWIYWCFWAYAFYWIFYIIYLGIIDK